MYNDGGRGEIMKEKWELILEKMFPAKRYERDMIWDMCTILTDRLTFFNNIDEFECDRAKDYLKSIVSYSKKPVNKYRMYIVSGIQFVSFAWLNIDSEVFERLFNTMKYEFIVYDEMPSKSLDPNLVSTVYLFKGEEMIFSEDVYPSHLAWLMLGLFKFNLIKYKVL